MPPQLCRTCLSIPPYFWTEGLDTQGFPWGPHVKLKPYRRLEASAAAGCPLCSILVRSARVDWLNEKILRVIDVTLSRAIIDSHQGVCLAIDADDVSHTTFYRVPKSWSGMPPVGLNEQIDNFQIMKTWIQHCRQNHIACNIDRKSFLRTRLLDLRAFGTGQDVKLTNVTDKLIALSGLAQHFQSVFPQAQYLAGIWSNHLPAALLWRTKYTAHRPLSYTAPTWSWASLVGSISYESQRLWDSGQIWRARYQENPSDCDYGNLSIAVVCIQPKHDDDYGAIVSASLSLHGALLAGVEHVPQFGDLDGRASTRGSTAVLTKNGVVVGLLYPNILDHMPFAENLYCLRIRGESDFSRNRPTQATIQRGRSCGLGDGTSPCEETAKEKS